MTEGLIAIGALIFAVIGSYLLICALDDASRKDYQRGLRDGRYRGDIGDL